MSFLDLESLPPHDLIAQYVAECRGRGSILPYEEYEIISEWLRALPDTDQLLLILSDVLPDFYQTRREGAVPRSLRGAKLRVLKRIKALLMHGQPLSRAPISAFSK